MASPDTDGTDDATENVLGSIVIYSSQLAETDNDEECGSSPPSPELGMGSPRASEVHALELEGPEEQTTADSEPAEAAHLEQQSEYATPESDEATRLPHSYQIQQSLQQSVQRATSSSEDARILTPAPTCPPTRRSARAKSTLVYDQKYHPLDEVIRPSQAAKRRTLHGEQPLLGSGSDGETSEESASVFGSMAEDEDSDPGESQPTRDRKRKRARSLTPGPTRRSSRRRSKPKTSYNMNIHPQDSDLKRVWACDGPQSSPSPNKGSGSTTVFTSTRKTRSDEFEEVRRTLLEDDLEDSLSEPAPEVPDSPNHHPPTGRVAQRDDRIARNCQALRQELGRFSADQDVWPAVKGLPFQIFTERIEDQLGVEAEATSPFNYDDDYKENDVMNPELTPRLNPLDGISIVPASHYRRPPGLYTISGHSSVASNAFYVQPQFEAGPYGLGWSDGAYDTHNSDNIDCLTPDYMQILASSERLPRRFTPAADSRLRGENDAVSSSPVRDPKGYECSR